MTERRGPLAPFARRVHAAVLVPPVLLWLAVAEIGVRTVRLPTLASMMGVPFSADPVPEPAPSDASATLALTRGERRRLRVLERLVSVWPFADGPCLRQSLVAGRILRRRGPVLRLGVALDGADLQAHAWLQLGAVTIGSPAHFSALTAG
ncbi:MAG TPA: lasso peptide biosynthesis B2 protein [Acidimicrobiales bacterium]|nr:lasso peptide biosynthesis B2 protein [Acidimicrobiales bacterium]